MTPRSRTDGALWVLMGGIVFVMVAFIFQRDLRLHMDGVWAQGTVVRKERHDRSRLSHGVDYVLHYRFPWGGGWRTDQRNVSRELWERLRAGSSLQVLHDQGDPGNSQPEGEGGLPMGLAVLAFVLAGGVILTGAVSLSRSPGMEEA
ncbi:DUF3592 domain-containing protein [Corallococcus sp. CA053C]|uniref:DUF3592 domain-containing protein n=1 Tax=Corallococcus sp. CA053C TaxID=2316732 RepID=UPI0013159DDF|nr:DUF3592 domain-containing protein [Corallococcus sp. CA053C]